MKFYLYSLLFTLVHSLSCGPSPEGTGESPSGEPGADLAAQNPEDGDGGSSSEEADPSGDQNSPGVEGDTSVLPPTVDGLPSTGSKSNDASKDRKALSAGPQKQPPVWVFNDTEYTVIFSYRQGTSESFSTSRRKLSPGQCWQVPQVVNPYTPISVRSVSMSLGDEEFSIDCDSCKGGPFVVYRPIWYNRLAYYLGVEPIGIEPSESLPRQCKKQPERKSRAAGVKT